VVAFARVERDGCILWGALLPTPLAAADPCACQGAHGSLVGLACSALRLIIDLGPAGMPWGFRRPLDKRVAQQLGTLEAPVDPGRLAAAFRDRRHARLFWECVSGGKAVPWCADGHAAAGSKHGPSPWQGVQHRDVGMVLRAWREGCIAVGNGRHGAPELGDAGVHQQDLGGDDAVSGGQRSGARDGLEAGGDDVGRAHVVGTEAACHSGAACEWHGVAGGPAAEEVAKAHGICRLKPRQDMRDVVFAGTGQAVGQTDCVADPATAVLDALCQGAHGGALGAEWGELVAVCEADLALECGSGGGQLWPGSG
jgi:hypothetical protein